MSIATVSIVVWKRFLYTVSLKKIQNYSTLNSLNLSKKDKSKSKAKPSRTIWYVKPKGPTVPQLPSNEESKRPLPLPPDQQKPQGGDRTGMQPGDIQENNPYAEPDEVVPGRARTGIQSGDAKPPSQKQEINRHSGIYAKIQKPAKSTSRPKSEGSSSHDNELAKSSRPKSSSAVLPTQTIRVLPPYMDDTARPPTLPERHLSDEDSLQAGDPEGIFGDTQSRRPFRPDFSGLNLQHRKAGKYLQIAPPHYSPSLRYSEGTDQHEQKYNSPEDLPFKRTHAFKPDDHDESYWRHGVSRGFKDTIESEEDLTSSLLRAERIKRIRAAESAVLDILDGQVYQQFGHLAPKLRSINRAAFQDANTLLNEACSELGMDERGVLQLNAEAPLVGGASAPSASIDVNEVVNHYQSFAKDISALIQKKENLLSLGRTQQAQGYQNDLDAKLKAFSEDQKRLRSDGGHEKDSIPDDGVALGEEAIQPDFIREDDAHHNRGGDEQLNQARQRLMERWQSNELGEKPRFGNEPEEHYRTFDEHDRKKRALNAKDVSCMQRLLEKQGVDTSEHGRRLKVKQRAELASTKSKQIDEDSSHPRNVLHEPPSVNNPQGSNIETLKHESGSEGGLPEQHGHHRSKQRFRIGRSLPGERDQTISNISDMY